MCEKDIVSMRDELSSSRERLMLRHIARIGDYIRKKSPDTRVLMWHDMLNNVDSSLINQYKSIRDMYSM
jgi:hypothetical protein